MAGKTKRKTTTSRRKTPSGTSKKTKRTGSKRSLRVVKGTSSQFELPLSPQERRKSSSLKLVSTKLERRQAAAEPNKPGEETQPTNGRRATAESLAAKQREISVSEFFTRNRHLLGFDNPQKSLLTTIKEAVDNSLDACEDAGILPDLDVSIQALSEDRFRVACQDNGPGIVKAQIPKIFAKLLYGSKFHTLKQSRGQQGIGISAASMYGQLTTGKPVKITSRTSKRKPAHYYEMHIDTRRNAPEVIKDVTLDDWPLSHGTRVEIELSGIYKRGRRSVDDYIEQTAVANPHASIRYTPPNGETIHYDRVIQELPKEAMEIKPHPYGVELGVLMKMLKDSEARSIKGVLQGDFSRVSSKVADEILTKAAIEPNRRPTKMSRDEVERIYRVDPRRQDHGSADELPLTHR